MARNNPLNKRIFCRESTFVYLHPVFKKFLVLKTMIAEKGRFHCETDSLHL
jgi:hypothetical protein